MLPIVHRVRVAIRHNHFRQRRAVQNRAILVTVLIAQLVQYQAIGRVYRDAKVKALPLNRVTVYLK